jgi:hypothetical protein
MSISALSSSGVSQWQRLKELQTSQTGSTDQSSSPLGASGTPPPFGPPPVNSARSAGQTSGDSASSDTDDEASATDDAATKLVSDLNSYLINLQSTASSDGSTVAAGTDSTTGAASTAGSASSSITPDDITADLNSLLSSLSAQTSGDLDNGGGPAGPGGPPPSASSTAASGTAALARSGSTASDAATATPADQLLGLIRDAINNYVSQNAQTSAQGSTTSLSA